MNLDASGGVEADTRANGAGEAAGTEVWAHGVTETNLALNTHTSAGVAPGPLASFYTYRQAAQKIGVGVRTLMRYANEVPPTDPQHLRVQRFKPARIEAAELERWVQARTR